MKNIHGPMGETKGFQWGSMVAAEAEAAEAGHSRPSFCRSPDRASPSLFRAEAAPAYDVPALPTWRRCPSVVDKLPLRQAPVPSRTGGESERGSLKPEAWAAGCPVHAARPVEGMRAIDSGFDRTAALHMRAARGRSFRSQV